jgi:hypothetical protein
MHHTVPILNVRDWGFAIFPPKNGGQALLFGAWNLLFLIFDSLVFGLD